MDARLLEISIKGDSPALRRLLDQDPLLLDSLTVPTPGDTPLHVASLLGHVDLASEILRRRPGLASLCGGSGLYPLHIAAAKGHLLIVKKILEVDPSLRRCREKDGRTPLHLAAANGHVALLGELLPENASLNQAVTERGETVLHLSVRYNQVEAAKNLLDNHKELINLRDEMGMTALHLATAKRHSQIIKLLLQENRIEVNAVNENNCTALDILMQSPSDISDMEICDLLLRFGGKKGHQSRPAMEDQNVEHQKQQYFKPQKNSWTLKTFLPMDKKMWYKEDEYWFKDTQNAIMIVSTVIAGATFQTGLNPPGKGDTDGGYFVSFMIFDAIALGLSMSIILFLVSGLSLRNRFMTWILTVMLWASVSSMSLAFLMGANLLSRRKNIDTLLSLMLFCWLLMMIFLFSYYLVALVVQVFRYLLNSCCSCLGAEGDAV